MEVELELGGEEAVGVLWNGREWEAATWEAATWEAATWEAATWEAATWESATWEAATGAAEVVLLLSWEARGQARVVAAKRRTRDVGFILVGGVGLLRGRLEIAGIVCFVRVGCGVCRSGSAVLYISERRQSWLLGCGGRHDFVPRGPLRGFRNLVRSWLTTNGTIELPLCS